MKKMKKVKKMRDMLFGSILKNLCHLGKFVIICCNESKMYENIQ